ncbi:hypothetical protein [Verrucomicrobium spinosum]|uniref:hypothetical protein n=1 Tax=Verrucomicrobium spinosum TaxID=2736 RepID=UPI000946620A|nr:hypothetical protein [Verrucomicrobium spinosum]
MQRFEQEGQPDQGRQQCGSIEIAGELLLPQELGHPTLRVGGDDGLGGKKQRGREQGTQQQHQQHKAADDEKVTMLRGRGHLCW